MARNCLQRVLRVVWVCAVRLCFIATVTLTVLPISGIMGDYKPLYKPAAAIGFGLSAALSLLAAILLCEIVSAPSRSRKRVLRVSQQCTAQHSDDENDIMWMGLGAIELPRSVSQLATQSTVRAGSEIPDCSHLSTEDIEAGAIIHNDSAASSTYAPINESEIRLLQIEGSQNDDSPLNTNLVHIPLLAARTRGFVALSYTWTKAAATSPIFVNGNLVRVRPNLARILRKLRLLKYELIWVDALCINQADMQERSQQVLRIGGIYGGALSVVVCVSISQSDCLEHAFTLVNTALSVKNQSDELHLLCSTEAVQSAVRSYCLEDYWQRIWILQEFAIGHKVDLLIGDKTFSVQSLYILIQLLERDSVMRELSQAKTVFDIRNSWQQNTRYRVLEILGRTSSSICDRRHDRIYGLLGLVPDFLDYLSEPSYEISISDMSISMARSYIERRSLNIIVMSSHEDKASGLPTWCPNYFNFDLCSPGKRIWKLVFHHLGHAQPNSNRRATRLLWHATKSAPRICTFIDKKLFTSAYRVGEINSLGHAWSDVPSHDFPICSTQGERPTKKQKVGRTLNAAMLRRDFCYYRSWFLDSELTDNVIPDSRLEDFCFLQLFSPIHGDFDPDHIGNEFHRWVSANRKFVFGGRALQEHAENLWPIFFHCGIGIWTSDSDLFSPLVRMAKQDMRLMCLDDHKLGIGWAAKGARLHDEVFLIPGCSVPVILRRAETDGQYLMIGDAIVIGAMMGEIWENVKSEDLCQIEII